ncbi:MAG: hypothetical protein CM1200mP2_30530 [Planctomycetaceae bacterium]|nr:MAG: hypothetical protein CM1200mP2_30530 [Planctomycetaceae bacterium]
MTTPAVHWLAGHVDQPGGQPEYDSRFADRGEQYVRHRVIGFALTQTVTPMLDASGVQTGSLLTQTLRFTNTGTANVDFEFVRYIDGDLLFDGTLVDGGGRMFTSANDEVLFETDRGGSGSTDTTFLGITGKHGTIPTTGRFELDAYSGLQNRIATGTALDDTVTGDNDGDQFVDSGQEYDITLALQNLYSLARVRRTSTPLTRSSVLERPTRSVPVSRRWPMMMRA